MGATLAGPERLRQAAKTWNEHGRSDDTLWTGATYREFASWRERYPGGLTELEGEFARAMTNHARRRTRRHRLAVAAVLLVGLGTLAIAEPGVLDGFTRRPAGATGTVIVPDERGGCTHAGRRSNRTAGSGTTDWTRRRILPGL